MKELTENRARKRGTGERGEAVSEALKSLLIFLLAVIMLVLMMLLMLGQGRDGAEDALPYEERMIVYEDPADAASAKAMETDRVVPSVIAWHADDAYLHCLFADTGEREEAYAALFPILRALFGGGCRCTLLSGETGQAFWTESRKVMSVYLRYPGTLPASVIGAYLRGSGETEDTGGMSDVPIPGDAVYIRELFLLRDPENRTELCAAARDDRGNVSVFRRDPSDSADTDAENLHTAVLSAYIETVENGCRYTEAVFCAETEETETDPSAALTLLRDFKSGGDTALRMKTLLTVPDADAVYPDAGTLLYGADGDEDGEKTLSALLTVFGMKGSASSYYRDASDARVYLDTEGSLTVGTDGTLFYTALQMGGLPLSEFLGYASVTDTYTLTEALCAADRLLGRLAELHPAYSGGDAELRLVSVDGTDSGIRLVYDCLAAGLPIADDAGNIPHFCTVTIRGGRVTEFRLRPFLLRLGDPEHAQPLLPQSVVLAAIAAERKDDGTATPLSGTLPLLYRVSADSGRGAAEWVFRAAEKEGTVGA